MPEYNMYNMLTLKLEVEESRIEKESTRARPLTSKIK